MNPDESECAQESPSEPEWAQVGPKQDQVRPSEPTTSPNIPVPQQFQMPFHLLLYVSSSSIIWPKHPHKDPFIIYPCKDPRITSPIKGPAVEHLAPSCPLSHIKPTQNAGARAWCGQRMASLSWRMALSIQGKEDGEWAFVDH